MGRPNHATIVAYLALFFAMSGTAYAAATIGSPEVKDNTLLSIDLKDGAGVKGVDVVDNSLTGSDISEVTLAGIANKILYQGTPTSADPAPKSQVGVAGPFAFKASCSGAVGHVQLALYFRGPAGEAQGEFRSWVSDDTANTQLGVIGINSFPAATDNPMLFVTANTNNYVRAAATIMIRSGTTVVQYQVMAIANAREGELRCLVAGTAIAGI